MFVPRATRFGIAAAAALVAPSFGHAQGFGLNEIGSCAVARAYAVTAGGCKDASTIYWNPGAATALSGWSIVVGAANIGVKGSFERDSSHAKYNSTIPDQTVPHLFINHHAAGSRVAWGLGVYIPYGLTSQWGDDFPGIFESKKASLATIYAQPNLAWRINDRWSIGGGPIVGRSSVELVQALDLSTQSPQPGITFAQLGIAQRTQFGTARLKGDAMGYGAQVGVSGTFGSGWSFGARYLTHIWFNYDNADATFTQVATNLTLAAGNPLRANPGTPVDSLVASQFTSGALVPQKVKTSVDHPAQAQIGLAYSGIKDWNFEADYAWVGWHGFRELPVTFAVAPSRVLIEDYNNSSALRLSAEYAWRNSLRLRGGFAGVASAAPPETVTPLLPEQDRQYYNGGLALPLGSSWTVDAGYAHIYTFGQRGRINERNDRSQLAAQLNSGVYHLSANIVSVTLKALY